MHGGPLGILRDFTGSLDMDLLHRGELEGAMFEGVDLHHGCGTTFAGGVQALDGRRQMVAC
jgi:hypothetical protein